MGVMHYLNQLINIIYTVTKVLKKDAEKEQ